MPRSVDPRWGEDGYEIEPEAFVPDKEVAKQAAAIIGISETDDRFATLGRDLEAIANRYHRWNGRGAGAFGRPQARKALEEALALARLDCWILQSLNERAAQCVQDELVVIDPPPLYGCETVVAAYARNIIEEPVLRSAIASAIARLKVQRGPEVNGEIGWAVEELIELYANLTGETATHSNRGSDRQYRQEPGSVAGRFVHTCFKAIDASVRPTQLNNALKACIKAHRTEATAVSGTNSSDHR